MCSSGYLFAASQREWKGMCQVMTSFEVKELAMIFLQSELQNQLLVLLNLSITALGLI